MSGCGSAAVDATPVKKTFTKFNKRRYCCFLPTAYTLTHYWYWYWYIHGEYQEQHRMLDRRGLELLLTDSVDLFFFSTPPSSFSSRDVASFIQPNKMKTGGAPSQPEQSPMRYFIYVDVFHSFRSFLVKKTHKKQHNSSNDFQHLGVLSKKIKKKQTRKQNPWLELVCVCVCLCVCCVSNHSTAAQLSCCCIAEKQNFRSTKHFATYALQSTVWTHTSG